MDKHIVIAEDEHKIAQLLSDYLVQAGFTTTVVANGEQVLPLIHSKKVDGLLLDIQLPERDGISILKALRVTWDIPVIIITARVDEIDRLIGLELGADDYICKPFSPREVVARLKAVLRRVDLRHKPAVEQLPCIALDKDRQLISYKGDTVELTAVEFQLMQRLFSDVGRIFSRAQLMETMYSDHRIVNDRTVDSHIKKLRQKLQAVFTGTDFIQSVYGVGYRFQEEQ